MRYPVWDAHLVHEILVPAIYTKWSPVFRSLNKWYLPMSRLNNSNNNEIMHHGNRDHIRDKSAEVSTL